MFKTASAPLRLEYETLPQRAPQLESYAKLCIPVPGNIPIEIVITGELPLGEASNEMARSHAQQLKHETFTDIFFEASAKICNTSFKDGERTAIYTFLVGKEDLEFHRHEGHRVIIGMVGSGGAFFRFSHATPEEERSDPIRFLEKMVEIDMPPDCRFVLRFSGKVYHQFGPKDPSHDAVFAISVHTDEAGGLSGDLLNRILNDEASIPILTEPVSKRTQLALKNRSLVLEKATHYAIKRRWAEL